MTPDPDDPDDGPGDGEPALPRTRTKPLTVIPQPRVKTKEMPPMERPRHKLTIALDHGEDLASFLEHIAKVIRERRDKGVAQITIVIEE